MSPAAGRPYDERSLARLEWAALLEIFVEACAFAPSRTLATELRPTNGGGSLPTLRALGREIAELRRDGGDPHIGGAANASDVEERKSIANSLVDEFKSSITENILKNVFNPFGGFQ